jgi:hypothetical protein
MIVDESRDNSLVLQPESEREQAVVDHLGMVAAKVASSREIEDLVVWRDLASAVDDLEPPEKPGDPGDRVLVISWRKS